MITHFRFVSSSLTSSSVTSLTFLSSYPNLSHPIPTFTGTLQTTSISNLTPSSASASAITQSTDVSSSSVAQVHHHPMKMTSLTPSYGHCRRTRTWVHLKHINLNPPSSKIWHLTLEPDVSSASSLGSMGSAPVMTMAYSYLNTTIRPPALYGSSSSLLFVLRDKPSLFSNIQMNSTARALKCS